jgi:DNA-binding transcriptional LysR family regulator
VSAVVERARALFAPADTDLGTVRRTFTILGHDAVAASHGPALYARAAAQAPGIRIRFLGEDLGDAPFLRDGTADLEGLISSWGLPLARALGLVTFDVPLPLPPLRLGLAWHPRHDADPAHAWLRGAVRDVLTAPHSASTAPTAPLC